MICKVIEFRLQQKGEKRENAPQTSRLKSAYKAEPTKISCHTV